MKLVLKIFNGIRCIKSFHWLNLFSQSKYDEIINRNNVLNKQRAKPIQRTNNQTEPEEILISLRKLWMFSREITQ